MPPTNPGTANLIADWPFDETSGTRADAHGSLDATDTNTVGYRSGVIGNAAEFVASNSERLDVPDDAALRPSTTMSLEVWVYLDATSGTQGIVGKGDFGNGDDAYPGGHGSFDITVYGTELYIFVPPAGETNAGTRGRKASAISAGAWTQLVVVYDGGGADNSARLKLYINGVAQTLTFDGTIPSTLRSSDTGTLHFGYQLYRGTRYYYNDGAIDQPRMLNDVLTQDEIDWLYNSGSARSYADLSGGGASVYPLIYGWRRRRST